MQSSDNPKPALGHILVAEDDLVVQMVVKKILEQAAYTVDLVSNGLEVISALETRDYDLILMDCLMPQMDGFEATRAIRKASHGRINPGIPVIAMTGLTEEDGQHRCLESGMDRVIFKPFDSHALITVIQECLARPESTESALAQNAIATQTFFEDGLLDGVIDEFLAELPRVISDLQQAVGESDAVELRNISHRFRGATDILKASSLSTRSRALEQAARDGDIHLAVRHALELIEELQKLTSMLPD